MDYKSKRWKKLRERILKRDGYMCQVSKRYGRRVEANTVHHIYPADEYPEYQWKDWNLISLSQEAHNAMHDRNTNELTAAGEALRRETGMAQGLEGKRTILVIGNPGAGKTTYVRQRLRNGIVYDLDAIAGALRLRSAKGELYKPARWLANDTILTFEGKEAAELIQGVWIVEIAELNAMKKADVSRVKQFLSQRVDRYRAPYGINPGDKPRSCVFFGTVNDMEFLSDLTGNRRFWPLDIDVRPATKDIWRDLTQEEIDQVWAEALMRWRVGERIYLNAEEEAMAAEAQEAHQNASPMEGLIMEFLDRKVPADWQNWTLDRRRDFWAGLITMDGIELVERTRICALEVQTELYNIDLRMTTAQIKAVLRKILKDRGGWEESRVRFGPSYGIQRGFCMRAQRT